MNSYLECKAQNTERGALVSSTMFGDIPCDCYQTAKKAECIIHSAYAAGREDVQNEIKASLGIRQ